MVSILDTLEGLRDGLRDSTGPNGDLDRWFMESVAVDGGPLYGIVPHYTDSPAGLGLLIDAVRKRWPECCTGTYTWPTYTLVYLFIDKSAGERGVCFMAKHSLPTHAMMLTMVDAAIMERDAK